MIRLTQAQIRQLDEYCSSHGEIPRATACRQLLAAQLRYARWRHERELRGLPTTGQRRFDFPRVEYADVRDMVLNWKRDYPDTNAATLAFNVGKAVGLGPINNRIIQFTRRALREREHDRLEADMNRAAEERGGE